MLTGIRVLESNTIGKYERLSIFHSDTSPFLVTGVEGLDPIKSDINTNSSIYKDGSYFSSTNVHDRNILIHVDLVPNSKYSSYEACRHWLYALFPVAGTVKLEFTTDVLTAGVIIDGYVESVNSNIFSNKPSASISIICVNPYFYEREETTFAVKQNYVDVRSACGTAPSPVRLRKNFPNKTGSIYIGTNAFGSSMMFSSIPAGSTLEIDTDPVTRSIRITNNGTNLNPYTLLTGGTGWLRVSSSQAHISLKGQLNNDPGFEVFIRKMYVGL